MNLDNKSIKDLVHLRNDCKNVLLTKAQLFMEEMSQNDESLKVIEVTDVSEQEGYLYIDFKSGNWFEDERTVRYPIFISENWTPESLKLHFEELKAEKERERQCRTEAALARKIDQDTKKLKELVAQYPSVAKNLLQKGE